VTGGILAAVRGAVFPIQVVQDMTIRGMQISARKR
jgi:hypothetical protein